MEATLNQYLQIGNMVASGAISKQLAQAIIEGKIQIVETATTKGSETVYTLTIDRAMSLGDMIAAGKYNWVNDDITAEHFPLERKEGETIGTEEREVILVHLDQYLTTEQVKAELDRRGLKPAPITELLALGAAHPDLQRGSPIVALGSSWRDPGGSLGVPALWNDNGKRRLHLDYGHPGDAWDEDCRFVALRK